MTKRIFVALILASSITSADMANKITLNDLKKYQPIRDCSKQYLASENHDVKNRSGKIILDLKLNQSGDVLEVNEDTKMSTIHNAELSSCLVSGLKMLKLPDEAKGKRRTISIPISIPVE